MLQVKHDGSILAPRLSGKLAPHAACIDAQGKRYALLTCAGATLAWDCNPAHDAVPCTLVHEFSEPRSEYCANLTLQARAARVPAAWEHPSTCLRSMPETRAYLALVACGASMLGIIAMYWR